MTQLDLFDHAANPLNWKCEHCQEQVRQRAIVDVKTKKVYCSIACNIWHEAKTKGLVVA